MRPSQPEGTIDDLREFTAGSEFLVIPYCHADYAWTHHRRWHEERYALVIEEVLDLCQADPGFRFCVDACTDCIAPFIARRPDRAEELWKRVRQGQIGVLAPTLVSPRPTTCPKEAFIRNPTLGLRAFPHREAGDGYPVMSCPDVGFGHSQSSTSTARDRAQGRGESESEALHRPPAYRPPQRTGARLPLRWAGR